jgi:thiamine biosynthesis lipoprotein
MVKIINIQPLIVHMKPSTRNLKLETRNFICLFRNPQSAIRNLVLLGIIILFFPHGSPAQTEKVGFFRQSRILMGTSVEISVSQVRRDKAEEAMEAAFQEVERINRLMSHYRPDSEVSQISRHAGEKETRVSPETLEVIERALYFSRLSGGAFDITIGPVFRLWNFREGKIPGGEKLREKLKGWIIRRIKWIVPGIPFT